MVMEAVTDKNGRFYFPKWGPKKAPEGHLVNLDPQLLLFKPDYEYQGLENTFTQDYNKSARRVSEWHGKTIELKKFKGDLKAYVKHFEDFNNLLEDMALDNPEDCNWKNIPYTIIVMSQQRKFFEGKGINLHTLSSIDKRLFMNNDYFTRKGSPSCGSPKEFFRNYKP